VASIERTAYPRFKRVVSARELEASFTPTLDEIAWAQSLTKSPAHLLGLVLALKCFQRLGRFPPNDEVPDSVPEHVRTTLGLAEEVNGTATPARTLRQHRSLVREHLGVMSDPRQARKVAEAAVHAAAETKDNPADLINVALEELVRGRCEIPGYSTLDDMAARIRMETNGAYFAGIARRMTKAEAHGLEGLLEVDPKTRRSLYDALKQPAGAARVSKFKKHLAHLAWADSLGPTAAWLEGVPPAKVANFAGEARVTDANDMRKMGRERRLALIACLLHLARIRARDDVATMFCKRVAAITKKAKDELEHQREQQRADSERLIGVLGDVLAGVREALGPSEEEGDGNLDPIRRVHERAGQAVLHALAAAGGVDKLSADHEALSAHHGNNYAPLMERFYRSSRAGMFTMLEVLKLEATTADRSLLNAVAFIRANRSRTADTVPDNFEGAPLDVSFAAEMWQRILHERRRPTRLVRRHLEICVFSYLAAELRSGDIAVAGSESYANLYDQLLTWEECQPLVAGYCAEAELAPDPAGFVAALRQQLTDVAAKVDAEYPDNADLVIDESGKPVLKRRKGRDRRPSALKLEAAVRERMPEWGLLDILTRTAYWLGWHRHFGPASGSDPKIRDALGRYVLLTFCYGANLGPTQLARHMRGVTAKELLTANKHADAQKINRASTDVINGFVQLDLTKVWGDGSRVGTDGTQLDTWADNLLAETSIRYGGYGGIAFRHISDTYIALFSHFIPCGVWEAVYIIEGLLKNTSDIQPDTIHADTQGQSLPAFGLALLLGFDLLPRIRNWADLVFYLPEAQVCYRHIDALFARDAVINWKLIERHWPDLMRTVLSIRAGRVSSASLLRRLGTHSHKNRLYQAFVELGRAVRTIVLLRYLSEPELREGITTVTNRVEAFHGFSGWLMFGNEGILADNDPEHQEKIIKFNELLANCAIYHTTLDITEAVRQLLAEGEEVDPVDLATVAPYITSKIKRFGDWVLDLSEPPPSAPPRLDLASLRPPGPA
jgi:TnpA family transposase